MFPVCCADTVEFCAPCVPLFVEGPVLPIAVLDVFAFGGATEEVERGLRETGRETLEGVDIAKEIKTGPDL